MSLSEDNHDGLTTQGSWTALDPSDTRSADIQLKLRVSRPDILVATKRVCPYAGEGPSRFHAEAERSSHAR